MLYVTLALTIFRDLAEAIVVGFALGAMLFIHRMSTAVEVAALTEAEAAGPRAPYDRGEGSDPEVLVFRIRGAVFFGAVSAVAMALERIGDSHRVLVIDFSEVTLVDSSAANMIEGLARKARRRGVAVYLTGTTPALRRTFLSHGVRPPLVRYLRSPDAARAAARRRGELSPRPA